MIVILANPLVRTSLRIALTAVMLVVLLGAFNRQRNQEHFDFLAALKDFKPSEECELDLELSPSVLYLGGAGLFKARLTVNGESVSTGVSVYFEPTRISSGGTRFYHYEWSEKVDGHLEKSYLNAKIVRDAEVDWIELGSCGSEMETQTYLGYRHSVCAPQPGAIVCT
jgi:hypothetical protein